MVDINITDDDVSQAVLVSEPMASRVWIVMILDELSIFFRIF